MQFPIEIPAGVMATPTKTSKSSYWSESNLVRWVDNKLSPLGGWEKLSYSGFASPIRAIHSWITNSGVRLTAFVCVGHVYVDRGDGVLENISPTPAIQQPSTTVVGGYGDNLYNFSTFGTPRPAREDVQPITPGYYVDNWGQNLVVMTSTDGRLLMWDPNVVGAKLTAVAGAPTSNRAFVVTPQRHVILFGAGGIFNRFAWCSQEDINNWAFSDVTKSAGFFEVQPAAFIVTAAKAGDEVLFWTSAGQCFVISYIGTPYIFSYIPIADGCVPVSPASVRETPAGTVWVTSSGPWRYESRSVQPVDCPIWSWVIDIVNAPYARYNAALVPVNNFSELWWFFPSGGSLSNDRFMVWNYVDGWWSQGKLSRSCGISSNYTDYPIMASDTEVFRHESGWFYSGVEEEDLPWIKTYNIALSSGIVLATFMRYLPDVEGEIENLKFQLDYNIPRSGVTGRFQSDWQVMLEDGFVPFRDTGRDFRLTIQQAEQGTGKWTIGESQIDVIERGKK